MKYFLIVLVALFGIIAADAHPNDTCHDHVLYSHCK